MSAPVVVAKVFIRYQWIKNASLDLYALHGREQESLALRADRAGSQPLHLSDSYFAEVAFTQAQLEFEGVLYVPKTEVLAIVKTMKPEDMEKVGTRTLG